MPKPVGVQSFSFEMPKPVGVQSFSFGMPKPEGVQSFSFGMHKPEGLDSKPQRQLRTSHNSQFTSVPINCSKAV
jgi:hypothetical protein